MTLSTNDLSRLLHILLQPRSLADRIRGDSKQREALDQIAASGSVRVVPYLLRLVAADDALSGAAVLTIAHLMRGLSPAELAWLDGRVRTESYEDAWRTLSPQTVTLLIRTRGFDPLVVGLLGAHRNGYVRAAVLDCLAVLTDGREIPFLALRAKDWVPPVAERATELLMDRLRPDNRRTVLDTLPFFVRLLRSRRRDHRKLQRTLRSVLLSDGGEEAVRRAGSFDTHVRRYLYDLLDTAGTDARLPIVTAAALKEPDAVVRARALRRLASRESADDLALAPVLEQFLREDPVPAVRRIALSLLSVHAPDRMAAVVPPALLDGAARVRGLARDLAAGHGLAVAPRDTYVQQLTATGANALAAAVEGVGETGTRADLVLIAPFLHDSAARVRRAALRAVTSLDSDDGAISSAIAALGDEVRSVRTTAVRILTIRASRVDFEVVSRRIQAIPDPAARRMLLPLLGAAPKWDAAAYFLQGLTDPHDEVRAAASSLLDRWLANFNRSQASASPAQLLRLRHLLAVADGQLSPEAARLLRLSLGPI